MSRYELKPKSAHHLVAVGWDAPSGSFFLQVIDHQNPAFERPVVSLGTGEGRVERTPERVLTIARDYAHVPDDLHSRLLVDRQRQPQHRFAGRTADKDAPARRGWRVIHGRYHSTRRGRAR